MARSSRTIFVFLGRIIVGALLLAVALCLSILDPLNWSVKCMTRMYEGSDTYKAFQSPDYIIHQSVYIFNYTNTDRFLQGLESKLRVEEVGPFVFQEVNVGLNMSFDPEDKVLRFVPNSSLIYIPELSVGKMEEVTVVAPNLVMIVLGTLGADVLPSWSNGLVSFIMKSVGSKPFMTLSAEQLLWGYNDPLVDLAARYFPGWINFSAVGILRIFYSSKPKVIELETDGERPYSILNLGGSPGLREQGYDGPETGNPCNTLRGSYQGFLLTPHYPRDQVMGLYKPQGCKVYPFVYTGQGTSEYGVPYDRFSMKEDAYNASSIYACRCNAVCPLDGLVDISRCFYGFPIYNSKPHFHSADASLLEPIDGLQPNAERAETRVDYDPMTGAPIDIRTTVQTNLRVHISTYNAAMRPLGAVKYLPVMWMKMTTPYGASERVVKTLRLLHVHGPRIIAVIQVTFAAIGAVLLGIGIASVLRSRSDAKKRRRPETEQPLEKRKEKERYLTDLGAMLMGFWLVSAMRSREEKRLETKTDEYVDNSQQFLDGANK